MKKPYNKPEILFDDFSLTTSITAGCEFKNGLHTEGSCGYDFGRSVGVVFSDSIEQCKYKANPDAEFNSLCYHNPGEYNDIFNS